MALSLACYGTRNTNTTLLLHVGIVEKDIAALAAVGDTDSIIRRLIKLPLKEIDENIVKTIGIMEKNGLYESISRYTSNLQSFIHSLTSSYNKVYWGAYKQ